MQSSEKILMIAPMMQYTDRHFRVLMRLLAPKAWLFTEMITAEAIIHTPDIKQHLDYDPREHPLILQIGGSNPEHLAKAASIANAWGFDGINLNAGCPSERVQSGCMGAALMKDPARMADCYRALAASFKGPVSIKTRLGVDECEGDDFLHGLIDKVAQAGCSTWIIHARKAWLKGLNPKQNRCIPPLNYDAAKRLTKAFPKQSFYLNGGIDTTETASHALIHFPGIMIGRAAYKKTPWLHSLSKIMHQDIAHKELSSVLNEYQKYLLTWRETHPNDNLQRAIKPLMGLTQGLYGASQIRHAFSKLMQQPTKAISTELSDTIKNLSAQLVANNRQ